MAEGNRSLFLPFQHELVVDLFAGGGGASTGLAAAYREPDVAVNHDAIAVGVHAVNHPSTMHYTCDVFEVDPILATGGRPVGVLWASPDCRHHSKAKGGKPRSKKVRGLAWVVVKWAAACLPRLIHLENVEEFADWGPLIDGQPCKARKGETFKRWTRQLEQLGYKVEWRELVAADYGAPTIRKRLYVVARRDGRPIVWPRPTHHRTGIGLPVWRSAAECIDWSVLGNSIFSRKKPLVEKTCKRIARGLWRHTLTATSPFVVPMTHTGDTRVHSIDEPLRTITTAQRGEFALAHPMIVPLRGTSPGHTSTHSVEAPLSTITGGGTHHAFVAPHLVDVAHGETSRDGTPRRGFGAHDVIKPLGTITAGGVSQAMVAAHIVKFRGESPGHLATDPLPTITAGGNMARPAGAAHALGILTAHMEQANGGFFDGTGRDLRTPVSTILASGSHQQLVQACLVKYYGTGGQHQSVTEPMHTVTTKARMAVVETISVPSDILSPEHLAGARRVAAFLAEYLPEHIPQHCDLILVGGYAIVDLLLRMLMPRELARAQGFPDSYVIERTADGKPVTKTDQVRLIGNSVCPDVAAAIARANLADLIAHYAKAAA